jgi:hypothetical protein
VQRRYKAPRILRRAEQVRRFHQTVKFRGGNQGHILRTLPADDYHFLVFAHPVENTGQILPQAGVAGFHDYVLHGAQAG